MSERATLPVRVENGTFSSERVVSFEAAGKRYTLVIDADDVVNDSIQVYIIARQGNQVMIDLPRETFSSGNRIIVPADCLEPREVAA